MISQSRDGERIDAAAALLLLRHEKLTALGAPGPGLFVADEIAADDESLAG